jgi:hypothetical protein
VAILIRTRKCLLEGIRERLQERLVHLVDRTDEVVVRRCAELSLR